MRRMNSFSKRAVKLANLSDFGSLGRASAKHFRFEKLSGRVRRPGAREGRARNQLCCAVKLGELIPVEIGSGREMER